MLLSVAAGGAFRGWQRVHQERFHEIVASLVEPRDGEPGPEAPASGFARAAGAADGGSASSPPAGRRASASGDRARRAAALRPASIDVDRASAEELVRLPGIGPALAARIVAERGARGPFRAPEGLLRVPGIGPKTLEKIRAYLTPAPEAMTDSAPSADRAK